MRLQKHENFSQQDVNSCKDSLTVYAEAIEKTEKKNAEKLAAHQSAWQAKKTNLEQTFNSTPSMWSSDCPQINCDAMKFFNLKPNTNASANCSWNYRVRNSNTNECAMQCLLDQNCQQFVSSGGECYLSPMDSTCGGYDEGRNIGQTSGFKKMTGAWYEGNRFVKKENNFMGPPNVPLDENSPYLIQKIGKKPDPSDLQYNEKPELTLICLDCRQELAKWSVQDSKSVAVTQNSTCIANMQKQVNEDAKKLTEPSKSVSSNSDSIKKDQNEQKDKKPDDRGDSERSTSTASTDKTISITSTQFVVCIVICLVLLFMLGVPIIYFLLKK